MFSSFAIALVVLTVAAAIATPTASASSCIASFPTAIFLVGKSSDSYTLSASGSPWFSATAPGSLVFDDNGDGTATLSGTAAPADAGVYTVDVTATNALGDLVLSTLACRDRQRCHLRQLAEHPGRLDLRR